MHRILLLFSLWLFSARGVAQLAHPYERPHRWAFVGELGGLSPFVSGNLEFLPIQSKHGFVAVRAGIGYTSSTPSFPAALTYNWLLDRRVKGCPPQTPRKVWFLETGIGGVLAPNNGYTIQSAWSPLLGIRRYFNYSPFKKGFVKAQLMVPTVEGRSMLWGGLSLGVQLD